MYQPMQSNLTLKALWRSLIKQLVLRELLCETYRVSEITESHQTLSLTWPRCSWGLCSVSSEITFAKAGVWGCHMGGGSSLSPVQFSRGNCPWIFSLSSEFKCVWRPRHAEASKICPFLKLESPKRKGLKSCLVPGLRLRRLAVKFIPHKQWGRPHWSPVCYSKIRTGEVCIVNLRINTMYPYLYLFKVPV